VAYIERADLYFQANDIADGKRVAIVLTTIGDKTYTLLRNYFAPEKGTLSLPRLFSRTVSFHHISQADGESVADYVAELRKLSSSC